MTFHCFGEIALHVFHPRNVGQLVVARNVEESPVQLGGGAAMAAQAIHRVGQKVKLHGLCGDDRGGDLLTSLCGAAGFDGPLHANDAGTSAVYLCHQVGVVEGLMIEPGGPSPDLLVERVDSIAPGDTILCPFFPGYASLAQKLSECDARLLLDAGFAPWLSDIDAYAAALATLPDGVCVAQLSLEGVSDEDAARLTDIALEQGVQHVVGTRGAGHLSLVSSDGTRNEVHPPPPPMPLRCAIGAGDVFAAHLAMGLSNGNSLVESAEQAAAAATDKLAFWGVGA